MTKTKQKPLTQATAVSLVLFAAPSKPMTFKQIARKASKETAKPLTEDAVAKAIRRLQKDTTNFTIEVTTSAKGVKSAELFVVQAKPEPVTPTPARPISYGRPKSNVTAEEVKAEAAPAAPVAGSRAAAAFIETLK